jgi:3-hydroxyisobutyrate dehydrogenase
MERIGFIGVGSIGAPMARCVIRGGFKVTVCDMSPRAQEEFRKTAFRVTDKASNCAGEQMVIVMVASDDQVKSVLLGENGLLEAVDPKRPPLLAIMSTILPQTTQAMAPHCAKKNVRLIDATVSGLPVVAEQGKLTIMVGGDPADLEAMRPVLKTMGENIFQTGALGSGNVTKLVNNMVGVSNLFLSVEAMSLAKKFGMDLHKLAAIMETASGRNFSTKDWDRGKATFNHFGQTLDVAKTLVDITRKDLLHVQEMAKQAGSPCPVTDGIVDAVNKITPQEIKEWWGSV